MITIEQIADWIIQHRKQTAFVNYSKEHIIRTLCERAFEQSILCIVDGDTIFGIVVFDIRPKEKVIYVYDILTTQKGVVKQMMKTCIQKFPGYKIQGRHRSGRERNFDSQQLANRL